MTTVELEMLQHLARCTFPVASWDKRFIRDLSSKACRTGGPLTPAQREQLGRIHYRYRRQHGQPTPEQFLPKQPDKRARREDRGEHQKGARP